MVDAPHSKCGGFGRESSSLSSPISCRVGQWVGQGESASALRPVLSGYSIVFESYLQAIVVEIAAIARLGSVSPALAV
jgi:hypothetical protein